VEPAFLKDPVVKRWHAKLLRKAKATARLYAEFLGTYWNRVLQPRGLGTFQAWLDEVKVEQKSDETEIRRRWGSDLEEFVTTYVSPTTNKGYTFKSRKVFVTAIRSFLYFHLGKRGFEPYEFDLQTTEERLAAEKEKDETKPISVEEYKRLVIGAETLRDKTILLTQAVGLGTAEWLQFAKEWGKYAQQIRAKTIPLVVSVVRQKTGRPYRVWIWDDGVDHLNLLLAQREQELGRQLTEKDSLFVSHKSIPGGTQPVPITSHRVQRMIRNLAEDLGLEPRQRGKIIYRIRPHEIGRDFFKTLAENSEVPDNISEYCMGHKMDPLEYNKFQRTREGEERILKQLSKLRPSLNVVSERGREVEPANSYLDEAAYFIALFRLKNASKVGEVKTMIIEEVFSKHSDAYEVRRKEWMATKQAQTMDPIEVVSRMSRDELLPSVVNVMTKLEGAETKLEYEWKAIDVNTPEELQKYYDEGWEYAGGFNSHGVSLKRLKTRS